ncbi:MAG: Dam family site-specific DNA-(adenine-N6)-methyltransferase [Actinomycetota bacterium]|jgi:DNA adenine methylase|nr:Dam family site-specific DNA-(adenine-N6)-methyltransferase [Actinomycetota bacterium]
MISSQAGPFLKWAGGKQGISRSLASLFPPDFRRYYEPFVGGGSVLFTVRPERAVIGDANEWLIDAYRAIREDWERVAEILDELENTKEEYMRVRGVLPQTLPLFQRAAHLVYLNKTCFRGLFRVNRMGQFNVPYGQYDRRYYDPNNLKMVAEVLENIEVRRGDFELCLHDATEGDFVYMDPPYYKLGGYSDFNRYTKDKFKEHDHFRLAAFCRELDPRGIRWAVSNSNTDFIRHLFDGYNLIPVSNRREINLNSRNRNITELLITNYTSASQFAEERLFEPSNSTTQSTS